MNSVMIKVIMKIGTTLLFLNVFSFAVSRVLKFKTPSFNHSSKSVLVGPNTPIYLLRTEKSELMVEKKINIFNPISFRIEDDTMFVEVLVIIDYEMTKLKAYDTEEKIIEHVLAVWDEVDDTYQHLKKTDIRISLAGIVIPKDSGVFNFFNKHYIGLKLPAIDYKDVMANMGRWLFDHQDKFPSDSYDAFMISTHSPDVKYGLMTQIGGVSMPYGACQTENYRKMMSRGGIIHDGPGLLSHKNAAHELAHILGAGHDQESQWDDHSTTLRYTENVKMWANTRIEHHRFLPIVSQWDSVV
ncbi:uncharacterized protein LOC123260491 [Cotesia glomerata]|uniref:uncharacterized protein LOC123260491 n=1 Tax=Cotesia glomerata TaxID=32391 RepID=UPI001D022A65|nr:uncharacterized protein LOC123260491 [Cotesia glomerata]